MKRFHSIVFRTLVFVWLFVVAATVFFNLRLYTSSPLARSRTEVPPMLISQLAANRAALDSGCASEMQKLFPEGFYFSYLFHGLTWVELGMREEAHAKQAIDEAIWCLSFLNSTEGRRAFPSELPPDHGMFYSAWKCSLRAGVVLLQGNGDSQQMELFKSECDELAQAIENSKTPFLASYDRSAWPCDTVPGIHALSVYDHITGERRFAGLVSKWLDDAQERLDPETKLLSHTASLPYGQNVGVARATSQVIILRLLPDIDAEFAKQQYESFRRRFLTTFVGAPCILEYPSGVQGSGDVDSGPLIFGCSLSATVMTMGVAQVYGDQDLADAIAQSGETVGLPWSTGGQKHYVGGMLPIGDIMVAYAHVARPWFADEGHYPAETFPVPTFWRWKIHVCSLLVTFPVILYLRRIRRKNQHVDARH